MIVKGSKINDRYQIIKTLGEGGMANVYLAHDTILDRNVAVKVLRGDLANDEKFVRRFQREALSASSLSHPNIVEMYDVGEDDGQYYIVMEYVDGKTLKQVLKSRGKLSITEVIDIMLQLTDGMAHAHDAYIIHRDIKPQNIMILSNGMIKITDFGVAASLNSTQLTQTNSVMGTVHYLPPEQAQGKGSTIKSDIYSMGIMMYELLTGLVPYKGDNAVEIALKHLKEPVPSVRKVDPTIPQSIENIIIRATAKNPKNRYTDARSMHEDLKTALDDSRKDEKKYVYKYPENDGEETKKLEATKEVVKKQETAKKEDKVKKVEKDIDEDFLDDDEPKGKKTLIIFLSIFAALALVTVIVMSKILGNLDGNEKKEVPNVSGKTINDATNELLDVGFDVDPEYKYEASETIEKGLVVRTSPEGGKTRKTSVKVILYVSSGEATYIVEDFTGQNYLEAKGKIEAQCDCNVSVETEKVSEKDKKKEDTVLRTEPAAGESSKLGSQITIFIPEVEYKYPDFTSGYTVDKVEKYAKDHDIKLEVTYQENSSKPEGTIVKQSRAAGSIVTPGATLVITVTTKPEETTHVDDEEIPSQDVVDDTEDNNSGE